MATKLAFPATPESLYAVRSAMEDLLSGWPLPPRIDATLLANELAALRVDPAAADDPLVDPPDIVVTALVRETSVRIDVRGGNPVAPGPLEERLLDILATNWGHEDAVTHFSTVAVIDHPEDKLLADDDTLFRMLPDRSARDILFDRYYRFATGLARRFEGRRASRGDVEQVAGMALVKALDRFDPDVGVKFTTFAGRTVVGELKRHLRDATWSIRVPRGLKEASLRIRRHELELTQKLGRQPTMAELAEAADLSIDETIEALDAAGGYMSVSIDAPRGEDGDTNLAATLAATPDGEATSLDLAEHWQTLAPAVAELPERQKRILYMRFFEDMTQQEIADNVGVSQMHVSRLLAQSLAHLRKSADDGT